MMTTQQNKMVSASAKYYKHGIIDKMSSLSCRKVADSITSSKMGDNVAKSSVLAHTSSRSPFS